MRKLNSWPVDVWTVSLLQQAPTHLSPDEEARAGRLKFEDDRVRWTRARSALRTILSRYVETSPGQICFSCGKHGKPAVDPPTGMEFNLSHAGEWAMIAVTQGMPVGIDIERIRANVDMRPLLKRLGESDLPDTTEALYQRWTEREAKSKATGGALFDTPGADLFTAALNAPEGYAATLALQGCEPEIRYCGDGRR
ncbi:MAG: hypothetical protein M3N93_04620 [Acidobacteriota bacterium]|nr:hypothetical protein [Acidobacteriota bacterium]